jgi:protein O-mannosyl-transferase
LGSQSTGENQSASHKWKLTGPVDFLVPFAARTLHNTSSMDRTNTRFTIFICVLLAGSTIAAFCPVLHYGFVYYDDPQYVFENPHVFNGLNWGNFAWAFTTGFASNWHPLTWISHMLDVQVFGLQPGAHHAVNLAFHVVNSLLLFRVLKELTAALWRSAFVAALFALHPLHVESVAWVAERKDVLSAFFFMLTLLAYTKYAHLAAKGAQERLRRSQNSSLWYAASLFLFALGLMSKPIVVTVPLLLLVIDFWPLNRASPVLLSGKLNLQSLKPLLLEKAPYFFLSLCASFLTLWAQNNWGAVAPFQRISWSARLCNAIVAYCAYLVHAFWPANLAVLYLPPTRWSQWQVVGSTVGLLLVCFAVFKWPKKHGWARMGWLWFLLMLIPVIGLVQVGDQYMADRYTYLPLIGIFILVVWAGADLGRKLRASRATVAAATLVLICLALATHHQVRFWENTERLFTRCTNISPDNYIAHNNLAAALSLNGKVKQADEHYREALRLNAEYADALHGFGVHLIRTGRPREARECLEHAARLRPEWAKYHAQAGLWFDSQGSAEKATLNYRVSLGLNPDQPEICNNLAWLLATCSNARVRNGAEAVESAERACRLTSRRQPLFVGTLAAAYAEAGQFTNATRTAREAVALADSLGQRLISERNKELLHVYEQSQPYHEPEQLAQVSLNREK